MSKEESEIDKTLGQARLLLIIGVIIIFLAPWIFTRNWCLPSFESTGPIGDTIGGITAPFLNLIGATLVFFALKAQVKANQLVQNQIKADELDRNFRLVFEEIKELRNTLNNFTTHSNKFYLVGGPAPAPFKGRVAIKTLVEYCIKDSQLSTNRLEEILIQFNRLFFLIREMELSSFQVKILMGDIQEVYKNNFSGLIELIEKSGVDSSLPIQSRKNEMKEIVSRFPANSNL